MKESFPFPSDESPSNRIEGEENLSFQNETPDLNDETALDSGPENVNEDFEKTISDREDLRLSISKLPEPESFSLPVKASPENNTSISREELLSEIDESVDGFTSFEDLKDNDLSNRIENFKELIENQKNRLAEMENEADLLKQMYESQFPENTKSLELDSDQSTEDAFETNKLTSNVPDDPFESNPSLYEKTDDPFESNPSLYEKTDDPFESNENLKNQHLTYEEVLTPENKTDSIENLYNSHQNVESTDLNRSNSVESKSVEPPPFPKEYLKAWEDSALNDLEAARSNYRDLYHKQVMDVKNNKGAEGLLDLWINDRKTPELIDAERKHLDALSKYGDVRLQSLKRDEFDISKKNEISPEKINNAINVFNNIFVKEGNSEQEKQLEGMSDQKKNAFNKASEKWKKMPQSKKKGILKSIFGVFGKILKGISVGALLGISATFKGTAVLLGEKLPGSKS